MNFFAKRTILISTTVIAFLSYIASFFVYLILFPHSLKQQEILFEKTGVYFSWLVTNWVWILIGTIFLAWILSFFTTKYIGYIPLIGPILLVVMTLVLGSMW